jgi:hypothetical protein
MKTKVILLTILMLMALTPLTSATITITPASVGTTTIEWQWSPITVTNISIDGLFVCGFDPAASAFTLSSLDPNSTHTIIVYSAADSGTNTTITKPQNQGWDVLTLIYIWWYLILIVLLCLVGMRPRLGIFLVVAAAVSLYALYNFITTANIGDSTPYVQIPFLIYVAFFIIPLWLVWGVKKGVFR